MPCEEKKKYICKKTCFSLEQNAGLRKTRTTDPEKAVFIYNDCMHPMMRSADGSVKLLMRIYLCPECDNAFFINVMYEIGIGGLFERPHYCMYCGVPVRDDYSMSCQLTKDCFNPDKKKCECFEEYCMISRGEDPYMDFTRNPKDAAFVRSVCDQIMLYNTSDGGIILISMHYCTEHKLMFTGNSEQKIRYCLYCGQTAHEVDRAYCYLTDSCFDLKNICESEFLGIR